MLDEPDEFCRLILLRHPELAPEFQERAVGSGTAQLSRRGRAQVARWLTLLTPLTVDAVHCADVPQAQIPARAIATPRGLELAEDARLRDQNMGEWQGRAWSEIAKESPDAVRTFFAEFGEASAPEGESLGVAVERVFEWWKELAPRGLAKTVAVVMAGSLIAGFAAAMLGMRLSRSMSLALPHGGVGVIDVYGNGAKLVAWNADALREEDRAAT